LYRMLRDLQRLHIKAYPTTTTVKAQPQRGHQMKTAPEGAAPNFKSYLSNATLHTRSLNS
jgi:hypothetical protein